jgi:hypothetical protein
MIVSCTGRVHNLLGIIGNEFGKRTDLVQGAAAQRERVRLGNLSHAKATPIGVRFALACLTRRCEDGRTTTRVTWSLRHNELLSGRSMTSVERR